jgi:hypothetical protein
VSRQVNIRLSDADFQVLVIGAALEEAAVSDEVRAAVERRVAELRADPDVIEMLRVQKARQTRRRKNVASLDAKRSQSREGNA